MTRHQKLRGRAAPLLLALFASACMVFVGPGERDDHLRELISARARWNARGTTDYSYVLRQNCYCVLGGQPVRVTVQAGVVVSAIRIGDGLHVPAEYLGAFVPVERLFDIIEDGIQQRAHRIQATYDEDYGFPDDFFIDFSQQVADEERGYTATEFTPAP
jgi:hypothetical protein